MKSTHYICATVEVALIYVSRSPRAGVPAACVAARPPPPSPTQRLRGTARGQGCMDRRDRSRSAVLLMGGPDGRPSMARTPRPKEPPALEKKAAKGAEAVGGGGRGPSGGG